MADSTRKLFPYVGPIELRYRNRAGVTGTLVMGDQPFLGQCQSKALGLPGKAKAAARIKKAKAVDSI